MSMKNSNDAIGNRTRDLPARSAVPQPTAPPRAPSTETLNLNMYNSMIILYANEEKFVTIATICTQRQEHNIPQGNSLQLAMLISCDGRSVFSET